ncbi:MAG: DoxX family protein [Acidimicrobiales bacterium]
MTTKGERTAIGLAGFQALDALACAIPLAALKNDLDRLGCSPRVQEALPIIKAASALGLLAGARMPRLGRFTAGALVAYFGCAIGLHLRAGDSPIRSLPAATMGAWAAHVAVRVYGPAI